MCVCSHMHDHSIQLASSIGSCCRFRLRKTSEITCQHSLSISRTTQSQLQVNMAMLERVGPVLQAVAHGAWDSCENLALNIRDKLPIRRAERLGPCLNGKVCVITGSNAGIGFATAKQLAERGAHVVLACRSQERAVAAAKVLQQVRPQPGCSPAIIEVRQLDLGSLSSVRKFCQQYNKSGAPLDILICNAGLMSPPQRLVTGDGLEMQFQVNFLSHWLLAEQLIGHQRQQRKKHKTQGQEHPGTRLVMLSSLTHHAGSVQWEDMQSEHAYSPFTSYALSKMCNTIIAQEFQRRFDRNTGWGADSAVAIHPGIVNTELATGFFNNTGNAAVPWAQALVTPLLAALYPLVLRTPESSAANLLWAATAPSEVVAGRYVSNAHLATPNKFTRDPQRGADLWQLACRLTDTTTDPSLQ